MGKVIAIDGPSGAGKSTIAKMLAEMLGFRYLDTGALYRATALGLSRAGIGTDAGDAEITEALRNISVEFSEGTVFLNNEEVSDKIREPAIGHSSSVFSARKPVRDFLMPVQREAAAHNDIVAEGRDMTTVVFPDAWRKFYIDARLDVRAKRRFLQLKKSGVPLTEESALSDVERRDERDSSREIAPLMVASDAIYLDTTELTVEDVMKIILDKTGH